MADAPDEGDAGGGSAEDSVDSGNTRNAGEATDGATPAADAADGSGDADSVEALREQVEQEYDFENFGPQEMAEMSPEEWEAAFDADAWVTGAELLDRVESDLRSRVANRDVFAVVERLDGDEPRIVAYSDHSYAIVHADGSVEGEGAVLRDVKPTVALASMPDYDVPDVPEDAGLPTPEAVDAESSSLGNLMLQFVAGAMLLAALVLFGGALVGGLGGGTIVAATMGFVFLLLGGALLFTVANARLSSRYRAEEFRNRLRAAGVEQGERPEFLPVDESEFDDGPALDSSEDGGDGTLDGDADDQSDDAPADP